ncbi:pectate lyase superfamily protein-domain-containing protein [Neurospora tetraspora]|uniref:Pectate lyase superfamily protein-domain-containing protein n=1 Tax=Neurospora tetraspora TaxID=94610 RepID=A0AAE0JCK3_9PEZI|nr:pectate lyase superfamily protein-domain-containing protein [Neurospora tetraspora]
MRSHSFFPALIGLLPLVPVSGVVASPCHQHGPRQGVGHAHGPGGGSHNGAGNGFGGGHGGGHGGGSHNGAGNGYGGGHGGGHGGTHGGFPPYNGNGSSPITTTTTTSTTTGATTTTTTGTTTTTTTTSTTATTTSTASPTACSDYWLENIAHQGLAPYAIPGYSVFRSVKEFGARGDGINDDTDAINAAISSGNRCGPGCDGSTTRPALVYFPPGTYLVSRPIIDYYYTQIIGNARCRPVIKASGNFTAPWVIDSNPYQNDGNLAWGSTNVFWRQISNFIIDMRDGLGPTDPNLPGLAGIHWPSSQATSLSNIEFMMTRDPARRQRGVFMESGSGGYLGDLTFNGGLYGLEVGNQQFTMRNLVFNNVQTAIRQIWSWGWTYQGIEINNCGVGFDFTSVSDAPATLGQYTAGSITILDSSINNTPIGIRIGNAAANDTRSVNNFIFENIALNNVPVAIRDENNGGSDLAGTTTNTVIRAWGRGNEYNTATATNNTDGTPIPGTFTPFPRPASLLAPNGRYYARSKPLYSDLPASSFLSARSFGATGNGVTDDTAALNQLFAAAAQQGKVAYIDHGQYIVTRTVFIPPGTRITGESYPQIVSAGSFFNNVANPQPVVQIGTAGQAGSIEWSDTIVSTRGQQRGAIGIQYNLASAGSRQPSGMWDVHVRIGGFRGSNLQLAQCAKTPQTDANVNVGANINQNCIAAFMSMHITAPSSGLYMENCWFWVADHDIEDEANNSQITVYAGRGLLIESQVGQIWLVGTGVEHHQMYEYQLYNTNDIEMGQIQTETAYYQPNPDAQLPFLVDPRFNDPVFLPGEDGWGLRIVNSKGIRVYGAGLYSFFDNYDQTTCIPGRNCQTEIFSLEGTNDVSVYNLNTVGTTYMATVNGRDIIPSADNVGMFVASVAWVHT